MSNTEVARDYFDRIGRNEVDAVLALFARDAEFSGPMGELPVPDGVRGYLEGFAVAFPGHGFEVTRTFEAGDQVAVEGFWVGRHTGPMTLPDGAVVPPTDKDVRLPFATLFTIRDRRIIEHRGYWDMAGMMAQLA